MGVDARTVMDKFAKRIGQPVVIINEPQAGGDVAMVDVARANADGYTLIAAGLGPVVANEYLYKQPGCDLWIFDHCFRTRFVVGEGR